MPEQARGAGDRNRARGGGAVNNVLLVDNYDSFTYNLAHYLAELGADVDVRRPEQLNGAYEPTHLVPINRVAESLHFELQHADEAGGCHGDGPLVN